MKVLVGIPSFRRPEMLGQLLDNLVDNAWKYSRPGSQIRISAEAVGASGARNFGTEVLAAHSAILGS